MESYVVIVLIFGIMVLFLLVMVYFINRLLQFKLRIDNSFLAIKDNLDDRAVIVSEMISFLDNNLEYEKSYRKSLVKAKELILSIKNNKEGVSLFKETENDIVSFTKLENAYKNLSKNKDYLKIKDDLLTNRKKLVYATNSYDKGVINYNNYRKNKFIIFLSKVCRIPEYDCYNN